MAEDLEQSLIGSEFDHTVFEPVRAEDIRAYAAASGEPRAVVGDDAVAPPTFVVRLRGRHFMPGNLPAALGRFALDAGKDIEFGVPIRVGDVLTGRSTIHDIYEKTGRTGAMKFLVLRTVVTNQRGEHVATIDQRMMLR